MPLDGKARRAHHREYSPMMLEDAGITFETKNFGAHLIVAGPNGPIDFWPGTGRWKSRDGDLQARGFGVRNLIHLIHRGESP